MSAILRWIQDQPSNTLNDLQLCGKGEFERIARDVGLSVSEFRTLAALDLDPVEVSAIAPQTFRDLQRVCSLCESHGRCLRDLAREPTNEAWKDYCPNVGTLMTLDALGEQLNTRPKMWKTQID